MRKYLFATLILLAVSVLADEKEKDVINNSSDLSSVSKQHKCRNWFVNFNVGYFHPFSGSLRRVIGEGGADYQLVLTYNWNCYFGCFISGDYFYKAGRSTGSGSKTSIWIAPLTVGLQASIKIWESGNNVLQPYFMLGPRWYFVGAKNEVSYLEHHNFTQGAGGVATVGLSYFYKHFTINTFVNSSLGSVKTHSQKQHVKALNTQVGGVAVGGGVGWNY